MRDNPSSRLYLQVLIGIAAGVVLGIVARVDVRTIFGTSVTDMANGFVAYSSLPRAHPATVALLMDLGAPSPSPERVGVSAYCNAAALNCPQVLESR